MGVTNLWQVLSPVQQNKPMSALAGKTIAVDLSIWVCENQCVKQMQGVVTRPYLRNLYFRINCLIQLGINLIFAVEGDAPVLKHETMSRRQEFQYPGKRKGSSKGPSKPKGRTQFNAKLRECCEMLDCLGVPYIQSKGEAEALCGLLNAAGIVDGCITNDGDVFLYGARTVYRNFSINSKDPHIEVYDMSDIEESLRLDREKMVALALLVGCDYVPKGIPGVGIERATKLLASYSGISPLLRFKIWKKLSDSDCFDSTELQIKKKAITVADFPQKKVIDEFLIPKDPLPSRKIVWKRPKLVQLQTFSLTKLEWPEEYTQDKVLPLITLWDMQDIIKGGNQHHLAPHRIVKARVRQGIPSYEVEWNKQADDRFCKTNYYITIEDRELFSNCFPHLVKEFDVEVAQKKSKTKGRKKKGKETDVADHNEVEENKNIDVLSERLDNVHLNNRTEETVNEKETPASLVSDIKHVTEALDSCKIGVLDSFHRKGEVARDCELSSYHQVDILCSKREEKLDSSDSCNEDSSSNCSGNEVSCAEENLSLRSRLLRNAGTKKSRSLNPKPVSLPDFLDSSDTDEDEKLDFRYSESEINNNRKQDIISLVNEDPQPCRTLKDGLTKDRQLSCSIPVFTPEKLLTESKTELQKPEFEESHLKIYNVSDFSQIGRLNIDLNTPNMTRLKNLSPSLYQSLLESTPTSSSKLRKAALLKSILNSPLQVDAILNAFNGDEKNVSPVTAFVKEPGSLEKSIGNLSNFSLNGTSVGLGNFQIESSLLRSIIASGGSTSTSFGSPLNLGNTETPKSNAVNDQQKARISHTPDEKCIVGKLSFDHINTPSIPCQEKSGKSFCNVKKSLKNNIEDQMFKNTGETFIDLTSDTPERKQVSKTIEVYEHNSFCGREQSPEAEQRKESNDCVNLLYTSNCASPNLPLKTYKENRELKPACHCDKNSISSKTHLNVDLESRKSKCTDCVKQYCQMDYSFDSKHIGFAGHFGTPVVNDNISTSITFSDSFSYFEPPCSGDITASKFNKTSLHNIEATNLLEVATNSTLYAGTSIDERSPVSLADRLRKKLNVTSMKGVLHEFTGK